MGTILIEVKSVLLILKCCQAEWNFYLQENCWIASYMRYRYVYFLITITNTEKENAAGYVFYNTNRSFTRLSFFKAQHPTAKSGRFMTVLKRCEVRLLSPFPKSRYHIIIISLWRATSHQSHSLSISISIKKS